MGDFSLFWREKKIHWEQLKCVYIFCKPAGRLFAKFHPGNEMRIRGGVWERGGSKKTPTNAAYCGKEGVQNGRFAALCTTIGNSGTVPD